MAQQFYTNRHKLESGQEYILENGDRVMLDRRVPGDGTRWYVYEWHRGGYIKEDAEIEPGDILRPFS